MIMFEQSRRLSEPLQWGRREKTIVAVLLSCVALAAVGLVAFGLSGGAPARADCIDVTFASTLGAANVHECGAKARRVCASPSGFHGTAAQELAAACRRAKLPLGAF
ncbi:MAG TPA: hypothetical protein VGY13_01385 [Solirubrobacteraceae bacterium]|jgi:hypothetical protein|nr:hypothetical protein [Solirubrobacteraceae bacterium]